MLHVEHVVNAIMLYHRQHFAPRLQAVIARADDPRPPCAAPKPSSHYLGDWTMYRSLDLPAAFFSVGASTLQAMADGGQNIDIWDHRLDLYYLLEGTEEDILTRGCWRMAEAGYDTLHDQDMGAATFACVVNVRRIEYGPTLVRTRGDRSFRKSVALTCDVRHRDQFTPLG